MDMPGNNFDKQQFRLYHRVGGIYAISLDTPVGYKGKAGAHLMGSCGRQFLEGCIWPYWREKVASTQWQPGDKWIENNWFLTCSGHVWLLYRLNWFHSYVTRALSEGVLTCIFPSVTAVQPDTAAQLGLEVLKAPSVSTDIYTWRNWKRPREVLLGTLGGSVPSGSPNLHPISDQKMLFFTPVFRPGP